MRSVSGVPPTTPMPTTPTTRTQPTAAPNPAQRTQERVAGSNLIDRQNLTVSEDSQVLNLTRENYAEMVGKYPDLDILLTPQDMKRLMQEGSLQVRVTSSMAESNEGLASLTGKLAAALVGPSRSVGAISIDPTFLEMIKDPNSKSMGSHTRVTQTKLEVLPAADPEVQQIEAPPRPVEIPNLTEYQPRPRPEVRQEEDDASFAYTPPGTEGSGRRVGNVSQIAMWRGSGYQRGNSSGVNATNRQKGVNNQADSAMGFSMLEAASGEFFQEQNVDANSFNNHGADAANYALRLTVKAHNGTLAEHNQLDAANMISDVGRDGGRLQWASERMDGHIYTDNSSSEANQGSGDYNYNFFVAQAMSYPLQDGGIELLARIETGLPVSGELTTEQQTTLDAKITELEAAEPPKSEFDLQKAQSESIRLAHPEGGTARIEGTEAIVEANQTALQEEYSAYYTSVTGESLPADFDFSEVSMTEFYTIQMMADMVTTSKGNFRITRGEAMQMIERGDDGVFQFKDRSEIPQNLLNKTPMREFINKNPSASMQDGIVAYQLLMETNFSITTGNSTQIDLDTDAEEMLMATQDAMVERSARAMAGSDPEGFIQAYAAAVPDADGAALLQEFQGKSAPEKQQMLNGLIRNAPLEMLPQERQDQITTFISDMRIDDDEMAEINPSAGNIYELGENLEAEGRRYDDVRDGSRVLRMRDEALVSQVVENPQLIGFNGSGQIQARTEGDPLAAKLSQQDLSSEERAIFSGLNNLRTEVVKDHGKISRIQGDGAYDRALVDRSIDTLQAQIDALPEGPQKEEMQGMLTELRKADRALRGNFVEILGGESSGGSIDGNIIAQNIANYSKPGVNDGIGNDQDAQGMLARFDTDVQNLVDSIRSENPDISTEELKARLEQFPVAISGMEPQPTLADWLGEDGTVGEGPLRTDAARLAATPLVRTVETGTDTIPPEEYAQLAGSIDENISRVEQAENLPIGYGPQAEEIIRPQIDQLKAYAAENPGVVLPGTDQPIEAVIAGFEQRLSDAVNPVFMANRIHQNGDAPQVERSSDPLEAIGQDLDSFQSYLKFALNANGPTADGHVHQSGVIDTREEGELKSRLRTTTASLASVVQGRIQAAQSALRAEGVTPKDIDVRPTTGNDGEVRYDELFTLTREQLVAEPPAGLSMDPAEADGIMNQIERVRLANAALNTSAESQMMFGFPNGDMSIVARMRDLDSRLDDLTAEVASISEDTVAVPTPVNGPSAPVDEVDGAPQTDGASEAVATDAGPGAPETVTTAPRTEDEQFETASAVAAAPVPEDDEGPETAIRTGTDGVGDVANPENRIHDPQATRLDERIDTPMDSEAIVQRAEQSIDNMPLSDESKSGMKDMFKALFEEGILAFAQALEQEVLPRLMEALQHLLQVANVSVADSQTIAYDAVFGQEGTPGKAGISAGFTVMDNLADVGRYNKSSDGSRYHAIRSAVKGNPDYALARQSIQRDVEAWKQAGNRRPDAEAFQREQEAARAAEREAEVEAQTTDETGRITA